MCEKAGCVSVWEPIHGLFFLSFNPPACASQAALSVIITVSRLHYYCEWAALHTSREKKREGWEKLREHEMIDRERVRERERN